MERPSTFFEDAYNIEKPWKQGKNTKAISSVRPLLAPWLGKRGFTTLIYLAFSCLIFAWMIYRLAFMLYSVPPAEIKLNGPLNAKIGALRSRVASLKFAQWNPASVSLVRNSRIRKLLFFFSSQPDGTSNTTASDTITAQPSINKKIKEIDESILLTERSVLSSAVSAFESFEILHVEVPMNYISDFQYFLEPDDEEEVPFVLIIDATDGWKKYRLNNENKVISEKRLHEFEARFLKGEETRWYRTEMPAQGTIKNVMSDDNNVRSMSTRGVVQRIVGSQFSHNVLESSTDTLVLFTASWCGVCRLYEKKFEELAQHMEAVKSIDFLSIDTTRNDVSHDGIVVERIPNVRFFKAGNKKDSPLYFDHARKDILTYGEQFLHQNATCSFSVAAGNLNCTLGESLSDKSSEL